MNSGQKPKRKVGMMIFKVKLLQKSKNNVFRSNERTKKVLPNIFGGFEVRKKARLMFLLPKDGMKGK